MEHVQVVKSSREKEVVDGCGRRMDWLIIPILLLLTWWSVHSGDRIREVEQLGADQEQHLQVFAVPYNACSM